LFNFYTWIYGIVIQKLTLTVRLRLRVRVTRGVVLLLVLLVVGNK